MICREHLEVPLPAPWIPPGLHRSSLGWALLWPPLRCPHWMPSMGLEPSLWTSWLCWTSQAPCCHFGYFRGALIMAISVWSGCSVWTVSRPGCCHPSSNPNSCPVYLLFASSDKMTLAVVPLFPWLGGLGTEEGPVLLSSRKLGLRPLTSTLGVTRFFLAGWAEIPPPSIPPTHRPPTRHSYCSRGGKRLLRIC